VRRAVQASPCAHAAGRLRPGSHATDSSARGFAVLTRLGGAAIAEDAVGLLLDCHARIRTFTELATRLAAAADADPAEIRDAARRVRRYFDEALPLHAQDEEESVLPRLRGQDPAVDDALDAMSREHREHEAPLLHVLRACRELERDPAALPRVAGPLGAAAAELTAHFASHLAQEEAIVFPAMRRLLSASDDAAVVHEMRARRAVPPKAKAGRGELAPASGPERAASRRSLHV